MRLKRLYIKNINSLKGEHTINFDDTPLKEAGLIAIVGKTGAGKSTILDAITLGLYNRIPRASGQFSSNNIQSSGALLTRGETEAVVEVDYEVKNLGKVSSYRSKWTVSTLIKGARKGEIRDYHMEVGHLETGEIIPIKKGEVPKKNEELIGLSYDQFVKSIMLSQGEFKALLAADEKDRSELLEKITKKLDYRQISIAVFERASQLKKQYDILSQVIDAIEIKGEEEIDELQRSYDEHNALLIKLDKDKTVGQKSIDVKRTVLDFDLKLEKQNEELDQVIERKEKLKPLRLKVEQYEQVLPVISLYKECQSLKDRIAKGQVKQEELNNQSKNNKLEIDKNQLKGSEIQSKKEKYLQELSASEKLWNEVEGVDKAINDAGIKLKNQESDLEERKENKKKLLADISQKSDSIYKQEQELQLGKEWLFEHQKLEKIAFDYPLLTNLMKEVEEDQKAFDIKIDQSKEGIKKHLNGKSFPDQLALLNQWKLSTENYINEALAKRQLPDLNTEEVNSLMEQLQLMDINSQQSNKVEEQKKDLEQEVVDLQKEIEGNTKLVEGSKKQLEGIGLFLDELTTKEKRLKWEAAEDIKVLRNQLVENEPCLVCGSLDHPYTKEVKSEDELQTVQKQLKEVTEKKSQQENELNTFLQNEVKFKTKIEEKKKQIVGLKSQLEAINALIGQSQSELELKNISYTSDTFKTFKNEQSLLQDIQNKKEGLNEVLELLNKADDVRKSNLQSDGILSKYEGYYQEESLLVDLKRWLDEYQKKQQIVENAPKWLEEYQKQLTALQSELGKLETLYISKEEETNQTKSFLSKLKDKRFELFKDQMVPEERKLMQEKGKKIDEQLNEINVILASLKSNEESLTNQLADLKTELAELSDSLLEQEASFDKALEEKGILVGQFDEVLKEESNHQENKKLLKEVDDLEITLKTSIKTYNEERQQALLKDTIPNETLDEIEEKVKQQLLKMEELRLTLEEIGGEIKNNEEKKKEVKDKLEQRDKLTPEYNLWRIMEDLIGSAKGDKFNKFAQSIVLKTLLMKANHHLVKFTDRYLFAEPKTGDNKQLFIIDRYAGDKERVVNSTSGGESFLLSLSLSLGLADMASKNVKVESLFIDEGFGTLDEQTLDQAISALEHLRDTGGKTISLISHLPQIKERIPTKIVLSEGTISGHSVLNIEG
ncbi:AAA family ATPase [Flammeovirga sp. MY04]|nr:AAA family ATPase [Flammeovirga sp. MY04]ANQ47720.1 AAA family ATPase [Flammeovirga sp. MY04]